MTTRTQLAFLHAAHFSCHFFLLIFPIAVIAIGRDWGLEYGAALALGTPLYVCFALGTLPAGWLGDRWDGEHLISLSFIGGGASSVFIAFAHGDLWLMVGLGALGVFASIYHPVGLSMVTRLTNRPGHALAVNGVFGNLGLAAASLSTGFVADAYGWRSAFLFPGIVAIGIGALHLLTRQRASSATAPPPAETASLKVTATRPVQLRVVGVVLLAALFSGFVFNGVSITLPKLFDERLGEIAPNLSSIGSYTTLVFAVAAFAQLPIGVLLDRLGGRMIMLPLFGFVAVALAVMSKAEGWFVIPSALVTVTLMFASIPITGWLLGRYVETSWRSRAFALEYVLALGVGSIIVPLMGMLHQAGYGFDRQYLLLMFSAGVVAVGAFFLPKSMGS